MAICLYLQGAEDMLREKQCRLAMQIGSRLAGDDWLQHLLQVWHALTGCGYTVHKSGCMQSWQNGFEPVQTGANVSPRCAAAASMCRKRPAAAAAAIMATCLHGADAVATQLMR